MMRAGSIRLNRCHFFATLAWCCLATGAVWAQMPVGNFPVLPALAVDDAIVDSENSSSAGLNDPSLIPWYKGVGTGVGVVLAFFIAWYLIYPWALRRGNTWPVTLFGRCTAAAWVSSWIIGLIVYWDDLPIPPGDTTTREWGLRLVCLGMAVLFGILCVVFWRSEARVRAS